MASPIIRKEAALPGDLQKLLGKDFVPSAKVWYLASSYKPQSLARIAFKVFLPIFIGTVLFFLIEAYYLLTGEAHNNEGFMIALIMFLFSAFMQGIFWLYLRKMTRLTAAIASGEVRFGLWITPSHLLHKDMEGLQCVEKHEIESTSIYYSGRPRVDMVVLTLRNKQKIYIVSDWLVGYYRKVELLKKEIDERLK